ncbi:MAG TPA: DUF255 domain-containing protein [Lacunisphaera sp.]|nr:DUF255 domain-containing protein [Lacunisphaera sp.]
MQFARSSPFRPALPAARRPRLFQLLLWAVVASGTNAIAASTTLPATSSALLRAAGDTSVQWRRWDAELPAKARAAGKPVYVFVGASLSELSRATVAQTFKLADTAAFLNQNFICVIVDREEQPDVAALLEDYLRNIKQVATWPAHVWLTPELQPFEGTGYLPPTEEWGKPSFMKFAGQVLSGWTTDPAGSRARAAEAVATLRTAAKPPVFDPAKNDGRLAQAAETWRGTFDADHGGFGDPPKKTEPELLRFLLQRSPEDQDAARKTLRAIAGSTLRDPLDGGFFRYAVDAAWHVPYQQKTLADQARIALAYLAAADGGDAAAFRAAAFGALDFALARLARPDGTFATAEDATGDAFASYYAWSATEIDATLGSDAAAFKSAFGVQPDGNVSPDDDPSAKLKGLNLLHGITTADPKLAAATSRLLSERHKRPAPPLDERATAGAHGLLLAAFAQAGAQPGGERFAAAATKLFSAIQAQFAATTGSLHRFAGGEIPAAPQDYAAVALGCREFGRTMKNAEAGELADKLLARIAAHFLTPEGRFAATPAELPPGFFVRPPAASDAPSAEALAVLAGLPPEHAKSLAASLTGSLDEAAMPPGDALLALAFFPSH